MVRKIIDDKLEKIYYTLFLPYIEGLEKGTQLYTERTFFALKKKFKRRWDNFVKKYSKRLLKQKARFYGMDFGELWSNFKKTYLQTIIMNFYVNIDRAFAQAQHDIEHNLGLQRTNEGFFGLRALSKLKGQKIEKPGKIEGLTRLSKNKKRIINISLKYYVLLLISVGQENIPRLTESLISFHSTNDLVWIDQHPCWLGARADEVCNRWRDRIVSLNGLTSGFPKMETAKSEKPPLFHPNCTHSYHALTEREANIAINQGIYYYSELTKFIGRS